MAKKIPPLTSTEVKHAKPKEKEYNLADGASLMLSGSKIWLFNYYRPFTKKRAEARALLADDIDPQEYKNQHAKTEKERLTNTLHAVYSTWFAVKKTEIKEKT